MIFNNRSKFNFIRYANAWEDADILCKALEPRAKDGRILSIASSGDNALALLTLDPKEMIAVDLSAPQLACLEIRIAAFKELDYKGFSEFLGILPSQNRVETYRNLQRRMSKEARRFWDEQLGNIRNGIIHAGKFERYLRLFGKWMLPLVQSRAAIEKLLEPKSKMKQIQFYNETWDHWRWRLLFKIFFSRFVMGHMGRDPSFFHHVEGTVGKRILARSKHALTECPTHQNPFLHYILKGNFSSEGLPRYLRPEYFDIIKSRVDRIKLIQGPVTQVEGSFDAFNLSDIFEYMDEKDFESCYRDLLKMASPKARLAYWNMLAPKSCPESCLDQVSSLTELSEKLHKEDKAWFYQKFVVEERIL